jgi:hypothetical protein
LTPRLVVPAYFHPAVHPGQWKWLAEHPERVRIVVLNVASGPGIRPEPAFQAVARRLRDAGITVIGYVDTNYGQRFSEQVHDELARYLDWYGVTGVCLDRAAVSAPWVPHYSALAAGARKMGADVVFFNHGTHPVEDYAAHADLLGTFEGPWPLYQRLDVPRWTNAWPAEKFYHVVYSVPPGKSGETVRLAARRRAAAVYVTERGGPNPYDSLPDEDLD